jgi:hypothetical protein
MDSGCNYVFVNSTVSTNIGKEWLNCLAVLDSLLQSLLAGHSDLRDPFSYTCELISCQIYVLVIRQYEVENEKYFN